MFTGIVQRMGRLGAITRTAKGASLRIEVMDVGPQFDSLELGESIAVDGTCLTVTGVATEGFHADASAETLARTTLGRRGRGDVVHLERALRLGDRMGGHLVTGHVDGVGTLVARTEVGESNRVTFEVPATLAPLVASKGSVAIDGVSLTVNEVRGRRFDVVLVPYTRRETTFDVRPVGSPVNVEVDVLAKYVARLLGQPGVDGGGLDLEALEREGYL